MNALLVSRVFLAVTCGVLGWSSLAHAQQMAPPYPPAATPGYPPPPVMAAHPMVFVHVQADRPVVLEALMPDETRWMRLCVAPCDIDVPLDAEYRVTGPGMQPSRPVDLEAAPRDRVVLDISVKTNDQHRTGDRLYVASWVMAGVGLALGAGALAVDPSSEAQPVLMWSGIGAEAAMVAMAITSHVLSQPTGVSQSVSPADPRAAAPASGSWARLPTWHDGATLGILTPKPLVVPLLSTSF